VADTTSMNRTFTEDDYIPCFEDLPPGYTQLGTYNEMVCDDPDCMGIYYQRGYITPGGWAIIERTPCKCQLEKHKKANAAWHFDQARTRRANLMYQGQQYFGGYDLLSDSAYNRMAFDNYKPTNESQQEALDKLKTFTVGRDSICLYGDSGVGKTHLALSVARKARFENMSVLAVKAIDMLTRLKRTYDRKDDETEINIMRLLKDVDLLVIDDIGQEKTTEWVRSKFYEVIDYRHGRRSTIYTTNLSSGETERKEGQALVSRIWGAEICLRIKGRDYRQTGRG